MHLAHAAHGEIGQSPQAHAARVQVAHERGHAVDHVVEPEPLELEIQAHDPRHGRPVFTLVVGDDALLAPAQVGEVVVVRHAVQIGRAHV